MTSIPSHEALMDALVNRIQIDAHPSCATSLNQCLNEALAFYHHGYYQEALPLLLFLAENRVASAIYHIGLMFQYGKGVGLDVDMATLCYEYVLGVGNFANAALEMGLIQKAQGNWSAAWTNLVIADMQGSGVALLHLHDMRKSEGFVFPPQDSDEVIQLLLQAQKHKEEGFQRKAENKYYAAAQLGSLKALELLEKMRSK
jgi:TPR repeat protein